MGKKSNVSSSRAKKKGSTSRTNSKSTSNRKKVKKQEKKTIGNDFIGGVLVVLGLILVVFLTFKDIGMVADVARTILKGTFGYAVFIFPIVLIIVGIYAIVSDKRIKFSREILKGILCMICISAFIGSFDANNVNVKSNLMKHTVDAFNDACNINGIKNTSGAIGTLISTFCIKGIGTTASKIIWGAASFIAVLCSLNISLRQFIYGIRNIFAYIGNAIYSMGVILFRKDEFEDEQYDEDESEIDEEVPEKNAKPEKLSRRERLRREKKNEKMKEKTGKNVDDNLTLDRTEQVEFDFNKLGGKPSKQEIDGKQKRDEFFKMQKEEKEDKTIKEVLTLDHTKHVEEDNYSFPPLDLLADNSSSNGEFDKKEIHATAVKLQKTLASFGVEAKVTNITKGPTVTRYELTPSIGVKVSKIVNLSDDIALNLAAKSIRIEAPIPGKAAVGIEIPNKTPESVYLREVISSSAFKEHPSKLAFSLGKDAAGDIVVGDIAKMPHVLIAGATGSGKSVCINTLITSILYKAKPSEVKMILIDPKMVELSGYNGIPHLLIPVVTDPKKAAGSLNWAVQEMVNRYSLFASKGVKDIKGYNKIIEKEEGVKLPQIVIIIDELADLMMVAPNDVEDAICRLAQMARAAGMHLVIATQRPSVDVITGIIKANVPSRIAFTVSSQVDSRTILDSAGAEKLLGKGDMLYFPVGETKPLRIQGAFVSEKEIESIVEYIKNNFEATYSDDIIESIEKANIKTKGEKVSKSEAPEDGNDFDPLLDEAIDMVVDMGQASASMIQRRFKVGYSRAGRIIDQMEERGFISGYEGSKPRKVLISKAEWQEKKLEKQDENNNDNE